MKRKVIIACAVIIILLGAFVLFLLLSNKNLTLVNRDKITRIEVINGTTGNVVSLEGDEMAEVLDAVYNVSGKKTKDPDKLGWWYSISFYNGAELLNEITMNSISIWNNDDVYYSVENGDKVFEVLEKHWN